MGSRLFVRFFDSVQLSASVDSVQQIGCEIADILICVVSTFAITVTAAWKKQLTSEVRFGKRSRRDAG